MDIILGGFVAIGGGFTLFCILVWGWMNAPGQEERKTTIEEQAKEFEREHVAPAVGRGVERLRFGKMDDEERELRARQAREMQDLQELRDGRDAAHRIEELEKRLAELKAGIVL